MDINKLKTSLSYWKSVAPEGATHYELESERRTASFMKLTPEGDWYFWGRNCQRWVEDNITPHNEYLIEKPSREIKIHAFECTSGSRCFTEGSVYPTLSHKSILCVIDEEGDEHDIKEVCGEYKSISAAGGGPAQFEPIFQPLGDTVGFRCVYGDKYFTKGETYKVTDTVDEKTSVVVDDDGEDHEINNSYSYFYTAAEGAACFEKVEEQGSVEFVPEFSVGDTQPWDGTGNPPVGSVVEYTIDDDDFDDDVALDWKEGDEIEILAYRKIGSTEVAICWNITRNDASQRLVEWQGTPLFRPVKVVDKKQKAFVPDVGSREINEAVWRFIEALPEGEFRNQAAGYAHLKPAIHAAATYLANIPQPTGV